MQNCCRLCRFVASADLLQRQDQCREERTPTTAQELVPRQTPPTLPRTLHIIQKNLPPSSNCLVAGTTKYASPSSYYNATVLTVLAWQLHQKFHARRRRLRHGSCNDVPTTRPDVAIFENNKKEFAPPPSLSSSSRRPGREPFSNKLDCRAVTTHLPRCDSLIAFASLVD